MLSLEFKEQHPDTDWRIISNMRIFLVHEYYQVDSDIIWSVIHHEMVELKESVMQYLTEDFNIQI